MPLTPEQIAAIRAGREALKGQAMDYEIMNMPEECAQSLRDAATLTKLLEDNDG